MNETNYENNDDEGNSHVRLGWNFNLLVIYQSLLRVGWIFKTESIIMPAVMDAIGGGGWLRGCLPMLNRLGQSVPPIFLARQFRQSKFKSRILQISVAMMGACFLILGAFWWGKIGAGKNWLPFAFLIIYGVFWLFVGIHNVTLSLLYGKLILANKRGKLMLVATTLGSAAAISAAWLFMTPCLSLGTTGFLYLFVFTGLMFWLACFVSFSMVEAPDFTNKRTENQQPKTISRILTTITTDGNFRLLCIIAGCYGMGITLFPHYQAYVKANLEMGLVEFVPWVIAQNLGAAVFSVPLGRIADRFGNRLALKFTMLLLCLAPSLSISLIQFQWLDPRFGFIVVFFLLGLTPVSMRVFNNYTLELVERDRHPIFLSTLGAFMALPVVISSTMIGYLVDVIGFEAIFLIVLCILFIGWILTFRLVEPRSMEGESPISGPQSTVLN